MAWIIVIVVIVFALIVIVGSYGNKIQGDFESKEIDDLTRRGFDLSSKDKFFNGILCIDSQKKKLILIKSEITIKKTYIIDFDDIISCELIKDGQVVAKKSTIRTVGGALIGGALAGGAGAIIGGLSGSSKSSVKADKIDLKIVVRNLSTPSHLFTIFDKTSNHSSVYNELSRKAEKWKDSISIIIDQVDKSNAQQNNSIADELTKLHELKEKGILSEEEFNAQKSKILN
jgi:hypothetical protein